MGCLFRMFLLLILPVAVIGLPAATLVMGLDQTPMVAGASKMSAKDLSHAQQLVQRYGRHRLTPGRITTITASQDELNALFKASLSGVSRVASRVVVNHFGVVAAFSVTLPMPANPLGRYVNIRMTAPPSSSGLHIARLAVGRIEVPPALALPALNFILDHGVEAGWGTTILTSIRSLTVAGRFATFGFGPPPAPVGLSL